MTEAHKSESDSSSDPIINNVVITVATANGSGSQTSNNVLMRAIFQMGVPVSGKNLFPSNIQGLPTWFTIRANEDGWTAQKRFADIYVLMNPDTAERDTVEARSGAIIIYEESLMVERFRDDCTYYKVPFAKICKDVCESAKLRKLVVNMVYVGVVAELLGIDLGECEKALSGQLKGKQKAIDINIPALRAGADYARENFAERKPKYQIRNSDKTQGKIIIEGNRAAALGAVWGGVTVLTWYPITPSSSLCEATIEYLEKYRNLPDGKATYAHVQAEDELASIGMVIGAGWAGARAMTATSGPGISLMSEFIGLAYFAEVPCVIGDVQRVGPSTGLPTRTMQGDIQMLAGASHGDTRHIVVIPSSVEECFEMMAECFNLAERFQTPVFFMTDLDLGMNNWMSDPFKPVHTPMDRGKVLNDEGLKNLPEWGRYKDIDGDGIPYRTIPGLSKEGAFFTRGSGRNENAVYSERPDDWKQQQDRLLKKYNTAREHVPQPLIRDAGNAEGLLHFGTSRWGVEEALDLLVKNHKITLDELRLKAMPFAKSVEDFIAKHEVTYIVEQNRDKQMYGLLVQEYPHLATKMKSITHYDGMPLDAESVIEGVLGHRG